MNTCFAAADTEFEVSANKNDQSLWLSGKYPLFNVNKDLNEQYGVGGSPTLVINGETVNSARDPQSYLDVVCSAFNNEPSECSQSLSTTSYSAGFGYDAGSSTTASCS